MFTVDTNFLMQDYQNLELLESDVVIPITVIDELDNRKNDEGSVGYNSRRSLRLISDALENDDTLPNGKKIIIDTNEYQEIKKNDHKILASAESNPKSTLITGDVGMRIRARAANIKCRHFSDQDESVINPGMIEELTIDHELMEDFLNKGRMDATDISVERDFQNACYIFKDEYTGATVLGKRSGNNIKKVNSPKKVAGKIDGRNAPQRFFLDMLLDPKIKVILVNGVAGSGKTLLALAAAVQQRDKGIYENIVCAKSVEEVGEKIGYRPGEETDKLMPYYAAFGDNLEYIATSDIKGGGLIKKIPLVDYEHVGYMRGRTFRNTFMILDECQNFSPNILKTAISRAGEGSKVVCCGDLHQIDNNQSMYTNGLFYAQRKLIDENMVGIISLVKSERSEIARLTAKL